MGRFVSHTSASQTVDGAKGQNNKMERGTSVSANPIWEPGGPSAPKMRKSGGTGSDGGGHYGAGVSQRQTPMNQHGPTGQVEHVHMQPDLGGHDAK